APGVVLQAEALVDEDASDHPAPEVVTQEPRHEGPRVTTEVLGPTWGAEDLRRELQGAKAEDSSDHVPGHPRHPAFARFDLTEEAGEVGGQRPLAQVLHRVSELSSDSHVQVAGELS